MKNMKKRLIALFSLILVLSSIVGMMPVGASAASTEKDYKGKIISILGDSISTYAGYIPDADGYNLEHLARYPQDNLFSGVEHTWWMQIIDRLGAKLGINDSWRGTTVDGKSKTDKTFALITNVSDDFLKELQEKTGFQSDSRIRFVGTVYEPNSWEKDKANYEYR